MAKAWLMVRAVVADASDRAGFDHWYRTEHLPDALKAFAARIAWRGWDQADPAVHCAFYEFESLERLNAVMAGPEIRTLVAEFDRCWGSRVARTRQVIAVSDELKGDPEGE
jgi:hypothetical protein